MNSKKGSPNSSALVSPYAPPRRIRRFYSFLLVNRLRIKIEDFKGLKMRMMPLMGDVLQKHGFSVIFVPGGEIMPNLNIGVLDAAEYSIPVLRKLLEFFTAG